MAQIVTITNPLTGQPAQVDQLEHTAQQIDDGIGFESTDYPGCYYRTVDGVTEWFNPPMQLGGMDADGNPINEYRTTERYLGKPVYVMVVDCGSVGANTWGQVSNIGKNIKDLVRFSAIGIEGTYGETVALPSDGDGLQLRAFVNRTVINNIYVKFKCDQRSLSEVKFTLWYTKTTD